MPKQNNENSNKIKTNPQTIKKNKRPISSLLWILVVSFITAAILFYYNDKNEAEQSLTYFPDDPTLSFDKATTLLHFEPGLPYTIHWSIQSSISEPTYLRQDVSLLFKDQTLVGILSEWKENIAELSQEKILKENESGTFEAISVHHAENHYPNNVIKGKEVMSYDHLSVMRGDNQFTSFKIPTTPSEKNWSTVNFNTLQSKQKNLINQAAQKYQFNPNDYYAFPLSYLHVYKDQPLPGLSGKATHRIVSQLWEGLYKNYVLGVHLSENDIRKPIGSFMPIILFNKNKDELLVIIQLDTGEITILVQHI